MRTNRFLCLAALLTMFTVPPPHCVRAQSPNVPSIRLPAEARTLPGRMLKLTADTDGKLVRWALANADAELVPFPDGKSALFCSAKAGRFDVLAWTAAGDLPSEAARCVVVVGESPVPPPTDPLAADIRKLLADDATPEKRTHLAQLAVLYREAVKYADAADVKTAGELATRIRTAAASLLPAEALTGVRKRVAEEIAKQLPLDGEVPLDAATRRKAAGLFERIAIALEGAAS